MKIYQFNGKSNICGENIRRIREYQKLTQAQLAARLQSRYNVQLEQRSISRIEIGNVSLRIMRCWQSARL